LDAESPPTDDGARLLTARLLVLALAALLTGHLYLGRGDGNDAWPVLMAGGIGLAGIVGVLLGQVRRNLRRRADELTRLRIELGAGEARLQALLRHAVDVVLLVDPAGTVTYASASVHSLFQVGAGELTGRPISRVFGDGAPAVATELQRVAGHPGVLALVEITLALPDRSAKRIEVRVANLVNDVAVGGYVLHVADVTERRRHERELVYRAGHDALTGLPNRAQLAAVLDSCWREAASRQATFAVLFADLDLFKQVNDTLGHEIGDEVLRICAGRLRDAVRVGDVALRIGGDEFVVVSPGADAATAESVARRIWESLHRPMETTAGPVHIGVSIGIALGPGDAADPEELLRRADAGMYAVKQSRRTRDPGPAVRPG
jgi:diguanylate cyclase (GGDEF)-like protein/PAS domain S-box-containing protein